MEDIRMTLDLIRDCSTDDIGISVSYPLPGTSFYEKVKHELVQKTNWTDSDDLALMFKNTYSPAFYKILHRYTHSVYRKNNALRKLREPVGFSVKSKALVSFFKHKLLQSVQGLKLRKSQLIQQS